ncbi:hypothetical protein HRbin17_00788 [bacterium HR17]|jgi:hypothetical protein|uniref:Uncharacterized protein n=1 Tax=Candidatus Fervidibacter japonicus TaxID=2035412 RepID=A0A2H5XAR9_9BACT|nr:hypothetical protein HRbin17_00788 [bacterium HR17]
MRQEVPTWVAAVIIVLVLLVIGAVYWYTARSRPAPEAQSLPASHQPAPMPQGSFAPGQGGHQPPPQFR